MTKKKEGAIKESTVYAADIMFVGVGEKGPVWPDTDGIIEAMKLAKENGLTGIEMFDLQGRDLARIAEASKELGIEVRACVSAGAPLLGDPEKIEELVALFKESVPKAKQIGCDKLILNAADYAKNLSEQEVLKARKMF